MSHTSIGGYHLGKLLIEGKTKKVYDLPDHPGLCLLLNKDRITAFDGQKAHELQGKAAISNTTNGLVFRLLNEAGIRTAYVDQCGEKAFTARKCQMIPIEWVTRRLATGSFIKLNPEVPEGYLFAPPKQETCFKDDASHDPLWCDEQIISSKFQCNGLLIGFDEIQIMRRTSLVVFEILERAWKTKNCVLVDMKVEFGVDEEGNILLADIIDSDTWRIWPAGDKRLMVDKTVYINLTAVRDSDLGNIKRNYSWVVEQLTSLVPPKDHLVVLMSSELDTFQGTKISAFCQSLGLNVELRGSCALRDPEDTLRIVREYEATIGSLVFVALAGGSNELGSLLSSNTSCPVINCVANRMEIEMWSRLNPDSGLGGATVLHPEAAALHAASILGLNNFMVWSKLRVNRLNNIIALKKSEKSH
ncbi:bifunctional phosphoribosylaminoimidazole carboxylase/phosphoribosylaminoimidazole succinocarboxamide synthetase [Drosophila biarmipes]|uniref:bifunctional phosphoribosylaminoimidazole carboxylase/phosphoribosylaminoimidazole succinocarboxamide synthetase n=1 Tax=Drosophila biarmipes TaxID=125945 RepID=UPI0007E5CF34|nr:bifunctional phosphoribosylaminoimidazole carboxylase/phosphoribosylaminoimidazole succinocarboxamide synthetase [Drosophila biarmipes]